MSAKLNCQQTLQGHCFLGQQNVIESMEGEATFSAGMQQRSAMLDCTPAAEEHSVSNDAAAEAAPQASSSVLPVPAMPAEVLLKAVARQGNRIPDGVDAQRKLLGKLSHLHLIGLQLQQLHSLRLCPRLQVNAVAHHHST